MKKKKRHFDNEDELDDNFEKEIEVKCLENNLERSVEEVPLKPPALFSSKSVHEGLLFYLYYVSTSFVAPNPLSRTLTYRRLSRFHDATVSTTTNFATLCNYAYFIILLIGKRGDNL